MQDRVGQEARRARLTLNFWQKIQSLAINFAVYLMNTIFLDLNPSREAQVSPNSDARC